MAVTMMGPLLCGFYLPKVLNEEKKAISNQTLYTNVAGVLSATQYTELCVLS